MEFYIEYLDCKRNFTKIRKEFKTYEIAYKWLIKNFEQPNLDFIKYENKNI